MTLTPDQREALARPHSYQVPVWALEFRHSTFPAPMRLCGYPRDLSLALEADAPVNGGESVPFVACAMDIKAPAVDGEPDTSLKFSVDNVSGAVQSYLATAISSGEAVEVAVRQFSVDQRSDAQLLPLGVIHLQLRNNRITQERLEITLGYTNPANRQFPNNIYTAASNPGLV